MTRPAWFWLLGLGALFSGAALVAHILTGLSLRLSLVFTASLLGVAGWTAWRRAPGLRSRLRRSVARGAVAGLLAMLAYDFAKLTLSWLDPSPYNPFEAVRVFGMLLAGPGAPGPVVWGAGMAFHALNAVSFGVAFQLLWGSKGVLAGIAWGLFLELFQLTLYPGWLDIRLYREFVQISALSHVVYGAVLGVLCRGEKLRWIINSPPGSCHDVPAKRES
ncbi:MAG: hypothetical protein HY319_01990 [Armatimonadetes bacterium]|nr:hypothetical protein [Armatimonadota bacterium]